MSGLKEQQTHCFIQGRLSSLGKVSKSTKQKTTDYYTTGRLHRLPKCYDTVGYYIEK